MPSSFIKRAMPRSLARITAKLTCQGRRRGLCAIEVRPTSYWAGRELAGEVVRRGVVA